MPRPVLRAAAASLVALTVLFFGLPVAAIFLRTSPGALIAGLGTDVAVDALLLSARTTLLALAVTLLVGTPVAWVLATVAFRGRTAIATLVELPLVLPPAVAGIALLSAFGRRGTVGGPLGLEIPFTTTAVVLALIFVGAPFYLRQAQASFAALDPRLIDAARASGAGPVRTLVRVAVPVAGPGLATGAALAWARALGEFGATIIFAGSLQGVTQTAPLAIYALLDSDIDAALGLSAALVVASIAVLGGVKAATARWTTAS